MSQTKKSESLQERSRGRTTGKFRCLNCFERIAPPPGSKTYTCPHCGYAWRVWWYNPQEPRIRGPVWETDEELAQREISDDQEGGK